MDSREFELDAGPREGRIDMGLATGSLGVYTSRARLLTSADALAEAEALGFAAAWVADTRGEFDVLDGALATTTRSYSRCILGCSRVQKMSSGLSAPKLF